MKQRGLFIAAAIGGAAGFVASFLQTLEKLTLLQNKDAVLACNLNSVLSCTNVLNSWQFSLFGFPNSLICITVFTIFASIALAGALGGKLTRGLRVGVQVLSLFILCFGMWFLMESTFVIRSICIFCLFCFSALLLINWAWLRINAADLPIGDKGRAMLQRGIASGADTFAWIVLGLIIAFIMVMKFAWL